MSHNKTPPPISCAENKKTFWVDLSHVLAVYAFFQAHYIPGTTFVPHFEPFHFITLSFQAHTSAPHSSGSLLPFHSASSINSVSHYPSHFPTHFQWYVFIFCVELAQIKRILLVLIRNGFFFQKDLKRQIQQGLFE